MGRATSLYIQTSFIQTRQQQYHSAYSDLRWYYRHCRLFGCSPEKIMEIKHDLWRKHGSWLDLVWQHHFARQVASSTGKGEWHGWLNQGQFYRFTDGRFNEWYNSAYPLPF